MKPTIETDTVPRIVHEALRESFMAYAQSSETRITLLQSNLRVLGNGVEKLGRLVHEKPPPGLSQDEHLEMLREVYREINAMMVAMVIS